MFNYIAKAHPELRNPVSQVKFLAENNQQDRVLTFKEQHMYLESASSTLRAVATLILETGMRPEEVFTLQLPQIHLDRAFLRITRGKTPAARRRVELSPEAVCVVRERVKVTTELETSFLLPCETDSDRPLPGIQSAHTRALTDSGVEPFRLYDLRHTWATRAAEAGIDLVTLASMLGHSKLSMVMRYAHPTQAHRSAAMERLAAYNAARLRAELEAENGKSSMQGRSLRVIQGGARA